MEFWIRGIWRGFLHARSGLLGALLATSILIALPAYAAPERLSDIIPDAVPDLEGRLNVSWNHQQLDLEGPFSDSSSTHDYLKLKYTFSPTTAGSIRYGTHDLSGDMGIISPLFNSKDSATSLEFDFAFNLLNMDAVPADTVNNIPFGAGSALNLGLSATFFQLDAGPISQNETLLKAYLAYSTDLTEELRAHTYFSTGRLSGDEASGSVNRIAAGLDYEIIGGCRPLVLMADGALDVYNFRQPSFNTSRLSQFNVGLRYRFAQKWYGTLGWQTVNDSESDSSGSGLFAGLNFVDEEDCYCESCLAGGSHGEAPVEEVILNESLPAPEVPAEGPPPAELPAEASVEPPAAPEETAAAEPPMMNTTEQPAAAVASAAAEETAPSSETAVDGEGLPGDEPATQPLTDPTVGEDAASLDESTDPLLTDATELLAGGTTASAPAAGADAAGVTIPPFPRELPRFTPIDAVFVRPPPGIYLRYTDEPAVTEPEPLEEPQPADEQNADSIEVVLVDPPMSEQVSGSIQQSAWQLAARWMNEQRS